MSIAHVVCCVYSQFKNSVVISLRENATYAILNNVSYNCICVAAARVCQPQRIRIQAIHA